MLLRRSWKRSTKVTCHRYSHHLHYPHNHHHQHRSTFPPQSASFPSVPSSSCLPTLDSGIYYFFCTCLNVFQHRRTCSNVIKCHPVILCVQWLVSRALFVSPCNLSKHKSLLAVGLLQRTRIRFNSDLLFFVPSQSKAEQPHTTAIQKKKNLHTDLQKIQISWGKND